MEARLIEKLDRQRYWAVLLQAVALLDIFVETTLWYIDHWGSSTEMSFIGGIVGLPLIAGAAIWYLVIEWRIGRDKELRAALHNEMYLSYKHRSQRITLWVVMCALLVCFIFEGFAIFPLRMTCEIIFFLGLATLKVSWLIYNRR